MIKDEEIDKLMEDHKRGRLSLPSFLESDSIYPISGKKLRDLLMENMAANSYRSKITGVMKPHKESQKELIISAEIINDSGGNMKQLEIRCPNKNTIIAKLYKDGLHVYTAALDSKCPIAHESGGTIKIVNQT